LPYWRRSPSSPGTTGATDGQRRRRLYRFRGGQMRKSTSVSMMMAVNSAWPLRSKSRTPQRSEPDATPEGWRKTERDGSGRRSPLTASPPTRVYGMDRAHAEARPDGLLIIGDPAQTHTGLCPHDSPQNGWRLPPRIKGHKSKIVQQALGSTYPAEQEGCLRNNRSCPP